MRQLGLVFAVSLSLAPSLPAQSAAEPPIKLAEFVVTPSRFGVAEIATTPAAASLTAAEIEVLPQLGDDLFRSIARLPGLAADDVSAQFWVRGAPQSQLLARLDGVDLIEPFHLKDVDGALSIVDPAIIQRLDLATGGFTAEYGDRLAGVLTMDTKSSARPLTSLGLSLTGVGGFHQGAFAQGRGRWLVSARRGYPDLALKASDRSSDVVPRYYDLFGKVEYDFAPAHKVSFHVLHAGDALRYIRKNISDPSLTSSYDTNQAWARWRGSAGERVSGEAVLSYAWLTWNRNGSGGMDGFPFSLRDRRRLEQLALRNDWTMTLNERLLFRGGVEGKTAEASYRYDVARRYTVVGSNWQYSVIETRKAQIQPEGTSLGGFLATRFQPLSRLVIEPAVRFDRHDWVQGERVPVPPFDLSINVVRPPVTTIVDNYVQTTWDYGRSTAKTESSPRLNAALELGRATVRAAWGRYAQAKGLHELGLVGASSTRASPTPTGVYDTFGRPERAEHRVVGIEYPLAPTVAFRIEAYERIHTRIAARLENLDNPYDLFPEVQSDRVSLNPDRGRARGIEALLSNRGRGRLTWHLSYALSRAEERMWGNFGSGFQQRWVPRSRDQRHAFYADATYVLNPRWQFSAAWQFHTGWPTTDVVYSLATLTNNRRVLASVNGPAYGLRMPDYHRLDLRATRRFKLKRGELRVFVDVFNAYDRLNVLGYDHHVRVSGTQVTDEREAREQLPFLPSLGLAWEF